MTPIVSSEWLNNNLDVTNLVVLDASFKNNKSKFKNLQIKDALFFDIKNEFSNTKSDFPNTLLSPEKFEIACQNLGINRNSTIIVYDNLGVFSSPRVWWLFKIMGHKNVAVLNGGLPNWIANNYKTEQLQSNFKTGDFKVNYKPELVKHFDFIKKNTKTQEYLTIDVRSENRFNSLVSETRIGLRSGNIPSSINIPYQNVLENGKYKSKTVLAKLFANFVTTKKPLIFSCGSGITACIVFLACELVLDNKKSIYDGSWTEYAQLEK